MLRFVFRKMWKKKWMVVSLLTGNLLMVAIAAAGPMYSQAVLGRMLTRNLGSHLEETNVYPGTVTVRSAYQNVRSDREEALQRLEDIDAQLKKMTEELKVPVLFLVKQYEKDDVRAVSDVLEQGKNRELSIQLSAYSGLAEHIQIVGGTQCSKELSGRTFDVMVNEKTFVEQSLTLGEEVELPGLKDAAGQPYRARIAGIFENSSAQDPYWVSSPAIWNNVFLMDEELFEELFVDPNGREERFAVTWHAILDYTGIRGDQAKHILAVADRYRESFQSMGTREVSFSFRSVLEDFAPKARKLNVTIWTLQTPVFVLLAAFIFLVSRQLLEMEQNEIAVYKSRGADKRQILQVYLIQSVLISMMGLVGGIPVGMVLCKLLGASNSFLEFVRRTALRVELCPMAWEAAGAAVLFSIGTMVLPVFRYADVTIVAHKRRKSRGSGRPWWQKVFLDVMLFAVSLYGLYQFHGQKEYLAGRVAEEASLDPLFYFCSSLFLLGAGLLVLRIFPWLIRGIFRIGKRWLPPAGYASFLQVIRTRSSQGFLMVFLFLTVAMGIFHTQAARTINDNAKERICYTAGADLVVQEVWQNNGQEVLEDTTGLLELTYEEPDFGKYLEMDGVEHAARVLVDKGASVSVKGGTIKNVMLMGIHTKEFGQTAWFKEALLPLHWYEYLNAISQNSRAILISANFRERYGVKVGDVLSYTNEKGDSMSGIVYGFVDYWPSYAPVIRSRGTDGRYQETDQFLIVAHLAQLQSAWGVTPYQVWIKAEGSTQFLYDYAEASGTGYTLFEDTASKLIQIKNDPIFQGTNGILTIGFICVLLLCITGFLIYWILSIQTRTLQFGIFRAMGMSMGEILSMLITEQLLVTGVSIGAGILVGRLASELFIPVFQMGYSASDQILPMEVVRTGADYGRLVLVIGLAMVVCMGILGWLVSKIGISQALKLGED